MKYPGLSTFIFHDELTISIKESDILKCHLKVSMRILRQMAKIQCGFDTPNRKERRYKEHNTWESFISELFKLKHNFSDIQLGTFRLWYMLKENEENAKLD